MNFVVCKFEEYIPLLAFQVSSGVSSLTNATLVGKESHGLYPLNAIFATGNAVSRNSAALDLPRRYLHSLQRNELLSNVRCLSRIWPKEFGVRFFNSEAPRKKSKNLTFS